MKTSTHDDEAMQQRTSKLQKRLRLAIEHAITAPSGHNTQPWKFRILRDRVELLADRTRSLPVVDPLDRELTISCGAALFQLRLAMNYDGLATLTRVLPDASNPDLLACVRVAGPHTATNDECDLLDAMSRRRTNRQAFDSTPVEESLKQAWLQDAKSTDYWIETIDSDEQKHAIADLVTQGDRHQAHDKRFRRELAHWVHPNRSRSRDGMPGHVHGVGDVASYLGPFVIRTFDWGDGQAAKDRQLTEGSPLLAVIGTRHDTPIDWIACGQVLAKMLLRGTVHRLDASYLNQPIEVEALRPQLTELLTNDGFPQILLRWGHGPQVQATPRRSLDEVLVS